MVKKPKVGILFVSPMGETPRMLSLRVAFQDHWRISTATVQFSRGMEHRVEFPFSFDPSMKESRPLQSRMLDFINSLDPQKIRQEIIDMSFVLATCGCEFIVCIGWNLGVGLAIETAYWQKMAIPVIGIAGISPMLQTPTEATWKFERSLMELPPSTFSFLIGGDKDGSLSPRAEEAYRSVICPPYDYRINYLLTGEGHACDQFFDGCSAYPRNPTYSVEAHQTIDYNMGQWLHSLFDNL